MRHGTAGVRKKHALPELAPIASVVLASNLEFYPKSVSR